MSYFMTYSGKLIDIAKFSENDVCLIDIAHALSKKCRFGGQLPHKIHYSVAQHSIKLANYAWHGSGSYLAGLMLLHDASEAYLEDVISDVKKLLPDYVALENKISAIIYNKYKYPAGNAYTDGYNLEDKTIKTLDNRIVLDEALAFFPTRYKVFKDQLLEYDPLDVVLVNEYGKEEQTEQLFLYWCNKLGIED